MKLRVNDEVVVIAGKNKGQSGVIQKIDQKKQYVFIKDVNKVMKHRKPTQQNTEGSIEQKEAGIHISNVAIKSKASKKDSLSFTKIKYKFVNDKKVRIEAKTGKEI